MLQHLAFIMDGNRRWARIHQASSLYSDNSKTAVKTAIQYCLKNNIPYISLYAFSLENFRRSFNETNFIFETTITVLHEALPEFIKQGINIRFSGERKLFPTALAHAISQAEAATEKLDKLKLNIHFCYGAQQEIIQAAKMLAQKILNKELTVEEINQEIFEQQLWTYPFPAPDIIIRTGKVQRLSNFLLYQAAYSEIYFPNCLWPDLTEEIIDQCVTQFKQTKRNFGT